MSRAFVSDKEDWNYCPKAGERCLHAEEDRDCTKTDCEFFDKKPAAKDAADKDLPGAKVVSKDKKDPAAKATANAAGKLRKTRRAAIKKPSKWGGRSGGSW